MPKYMTGPDNPTDTGNYHFFNTFGYVKSPEQNTLDGIAKSCEAHIEPIKLHGNQLNQYQPKRPLPKQKSVVKYFKSGKTSTYRKVCGPCFFPVNKN